MVPKAARLAAVVAAALALAACAGPPSAEEVRGEIERQIPGARFERSEHLRLGRVSLRLVRWLASFDDDPQDRKDRELLSAISGVEVATYKVLSLPPVESLRLPQTVERRLLANGWTTMVRNEEKNEHTWILYRGAGGAHPEVIRDFYIVSLDTKELALVRVSGHLDKLMAEAMAQEPRKMAKLAKNG